MVQTSKFHRLIKIYFSSNYKNADYIVSSICDWIIAENFFIIPGILNGKTATVSAEIRVHHGLPIIPQVDEVLIASFLILSNPFLVMCCVSALGYGIG
jgi:hypothetical protein